MLRGLRHKGLDMSHIRSIEQSIGFAYSQNQILCNNMNASKRPDHISQNPYGSQMYICWMFKRPAIGLSDQIEKDQRPSFPINSQTEKERKKLHEKEDAVPQILYPVWVIPDHLDIYKTKESVKKRKQDTSTKQVVAKPLIFWSLKPMGSHELYGRNVY